MPIVNLLDSFHGATINFQVARGFRTFCHARGVDIPKDSEGFEKVLEKSRADLKMTCGFLMDGDSRAGIARSVFDSKFHFVIPDDTPESLINTSEKPSSWVDFILGENEEKEKAAIYALLFLKLLDTKTFNLDLLLRYGGEEFTFLVDALISNDENRDILIDTINRIGEQESFHEGLPNPRTFPDHTYTDRQRQLIDIFAKGILYSIRNDYIADLGNRDGLPFPETGYELRQTDLDQIVAISKKSRVQGGIGFSDPRFFDDLNEFLGLDRNFIENHRESGTNPIDLSSEERHKYEFIKLFGVDPLRTLSHQEVGFLMNEWLGEDVRPISLSHKHEYCLRGQVLKSLIGIQA